MAYSDRPISPQALPAGAGAAAALGPDAGLAERLHNGCAQTLAAASIHLSLLEGRLQEAAPALVPALQECQRLVDEAAQSVREIARQLAPALLLAMGLEAALKEVARRCGRLESSGEVLRLRPTAEALLFEIGQCWLQAGATVRLDFSARGIALRSAANPTLVHLGWASPASETVRRLQERIEELGGSLGHEPTGTDTDLLAFLPAGEATR